MRQAPNETFFAPNTSLNVWTLFSLSPSTSLVPQTNRRLGKKLQEEVQYLSTRIERSYAAAADIVAQLDNAALAQGRKINKALAADLLDKPE